MSPLLWLLLIVSIVATLGLTSLIVYFFIIQPRRRRRPLIQALDIIERDATDEFSRAAELLSQALISGLKAREIAEARFALIYLRARLGKYSQALSVFADFEPSAQLDRATVYLHLWLLAREKRYDEVEQVYQENAKTLSDLLDSKLIAGIAFLKNARRSWARREIELAISYYDRLRKLGVLVEEIPQRVGDLQVLFGIAALFDNHVDDAVKYFNGAVETAKKEGKSPVAGQLGLLLCRWSQKEDSDVEKELFSIIKSFQEEHKAAHGRKEKKNKRDDAKADETGEALPMDEQTFLLRNCCLWYAFTLLAAWLQRPEKSALTAMDLKFLDDRLEEVIKLDPEMGDPYLIGGLIAYYFAGSDPEVRQQALARLEKAIKSGVNVPEVIVLLRKEKRLEELYRDAITRYLVTVKQFIQSPDRPEKLRREMKERMERYARFREMGEIDLVKGDDDTAPTVADMEYRTQILYNRLEKIVKPKIKNADSSVAGQFNKLGDKLIRDVKAMTENARQVEQTEQQLVMQAGEFLFPEEENIVEQDDTENGRTGKSR